jgi:hypothetical protein
MHLRRLRLFLSLVSKYIFNLSAPYIYVYVVNFVYLRKLATICLLNLKECYIRLFTNAFYKFSDPKISSFWGYLKRKCPAIRRLVL